MIHEHRTEFFLACDTSRQIEPEDCVTVVADGDGSYQTLTAGWSLVCWDYVYYEGAEDELVLRMYLDRDHAVTGTVLYSEIEEGEG